LGRLRYIQGLNYKPRMSIGKVGAAQPIPAGCDYDLWCGPAPKKPLRREYLHYDWHWDWDTGNGDLGNMGIHFMDGCRWVAGQNTLPRHVLAVGGRLGYDDDGETPNTLITLLDYRPVPIIFEVRGLPKAARYLATDWRRKTGETMDLYRGMRLGVIVHCEGGTVRFGSGSGCAAYDPQDRKIRDFTGERVGTKQNFIDCVRSRRVKTCTHRRSKGISPAVWCI
jgi:predicted dehydrogenase